MLKLIEEEKLDISEVSLSQVADQYLSRLQQLGDNINPAELSDFLVIAAKLLVIKSQSLLPGLVENEDEGDLERRLKIYKIYRDASLGIKEIIGQGNFGFKRLPVKISLHKSFFPPPKMTGKDLEKVITRLLANLEHSWERQRQTRVRSTVSIGQRIRQLKDLLARVKQVGFTVFLQSARNKSEIVVSFLALLELIKQQRLVALLEEGGDIIIKTID